MSRPRLVIVTGKGGVGKTTIAASLGRASAEAGQTTLVVEIAKPGRLGAILGTDGLDQRPRDVAPGLYAVALDEVRCIEDLIHDLVPLRVLSRRLLSSRTFRVLCAAVPGILETALLARVVRYAEKPSPGEPQFDLVVLDAPASGHSVPLLRAPRTLGRVATIGPLAESLRHLERWLADPERCHAAVVATPEDWAVAEAVELYATLRDALAVPLLPPMLNEAWPRRFSPSEERALDAAEHEATIDPGLLQAGHFFRSKRERTRVSVRKLAAETHQPVIELPFVFAAGMSLADLDPLARALRGVATDAR